LTRNSAVANPAGPAPAITTSNFREGFIEAFNAQHQNERGASISSMRRVNCI
jgi:hypothetical protein